LEPEASEESEASGSFKYLFLFTNFSYSYSMINLVGSDISQEAEGGINAGEPDDYIRAFECARKRWQSGLWQAAERSFV
jgi:hypothetical protein